MVKSIVKNVQLSNFRLEGTSLLNEVSLKINASQVKMINYEMHDNYEIDLSLITERLEAITRKFRKCEMTYYLYFEDLHHDVLTINPRDLPISRECTFTDGTAVSKQYFDVTDRLLYQELIDYHFQEFILFIAAVLENLVYLSETLIRKIVVHLKNKHPQSIPMQSYIALLDFLVRLGYRTTDPIALCLNHHKPFFDRYLPTINVFRNVYIHGYTTRLASGNYEYILEKTISPISASAPDVNIEEFAKRVLDGVKLLIPEFLTAIKDTVNSASFVPA